MRLPLNRSEHKSVTALTKCLDIGRNLVETTSNIIKGNVHVRSQLTLQIGVPYSMLNDKCVDWSREARFVALFSGPVIGPSGIYKTAPSVTNACSFNNDKTPSQCTNVVDMTVEYFDDVINSR